jgi:hypothetical protein
MVMGQTLLGWWHLGKFLSFFEFLGIFIYFLSGTTTLDSDYEMAGNPMNTNEQSDFIFIFHKHSIYFFVNFMEIFSISVIIWVEF